MAKPLSTYIHTPQPIDVLALAGVTEMALSGEVEIRSYHFPLRPNSSYTVEYKFSSDSNVTAKIELEQSNQKPTTEGVQDDNFVIPDNQSPINGNIEDTNVHHAPMFAVVTAFARFKITGLPSNHSSTKLTRLKLTMVENA